MVCPDPFFTKLRLDIFESAQIRLFESTYEAWIRIRIRRYDTTRHNNTENLQILRYDTL
ncbi:hypothetical protein C1H46_034256 [Malus baccata]|uniref:Uncharacterized protein n=1 Tax=Malus baccata TaxID=106549 RepID=A0A540L1P3_MALBA|nr:hypothetical protein C1H46_034256 [Malus baccata]